MQVQEEMARRANLHAGKDRHKRLYSAKYALSSLVLCGECGEIYRRVHWNNRGVKSIVWRCRSRLEEKGSDCSSPTIPEEKLQNAVTRAINRVVADRDGFIAALQQNIETVLCEAFDKDTGDIDVKLEELQKELLHLANSRADYEKVADEIHHLRDLRQNTMAHNAERQTQRQRIVEMTEFLLGQSGVLIKYDDKLVRRLVESVTVFEDRLTVRFMSGVEVEIEI
jgi:hypothetical protein